MEFVDLIRTSQPDLFNVLSNWSTVMVTYLMVVLNGQVKVAEIYIMVCSGIRTWYPCRQSFVSFSICESGCVDQKIIIQLIQWFNGQALSRGL